jgi:galactan 5-O-arabinofuranosyltransferase
MSRTREPALQEDGGGWRELAFEAVIALAAMTLFLLFSTTIRINPMQRIGQVSGLASLQLRFIAIALPLLLAAIIAARLDRGVARIVRITCAAFAGLASAFVAGGVMVALRHTPYCLNAHNGDTGLIGAWANAFSNHDTAGYPPPFYPPAFPHILSWYKDLTDQPALYALKDLEIVVTALIGPATYVCWRRLLRPMWALGIGVIAMLVLLEPYKPYEGITLVLLIPVLIQFAQALRTAEDRTIHQLAKSGVGYGLALGLLCLMYSGWFKWSAPGFVLAALWLIPWRDGRWRAAVMLAAITVLVFGVVMWSYLANIVGFSHASGLASVAGIGKQIIRDDYVYFDVLVDPAYFAMWKTDLPGAVAAWPPAGELGGISVYVLVLFTAFGAAIAWARERTEVIVLASIIAGAWVIRFWYAHKMYETKLVQLYPRTSIELAYCFALVAGFAIHAAARRFASRETTVARASSYAIGALCAFALVIGTAGSAIADRYMPNNEVRGLGILAYTSHDAVTQNVPPDPP